MITKEQTIAALGHHPAAQILAGMNLPASVTGNTPAQYLLSAFAWVRLRRVGHIGSKSIVS